MTSTSPGLSRAPKAPPSSPGVASPSGEVDALRDFLPIVPPTQVEVWYLAICHRHGADFAEPFLDEGERDDWAAEHVTATGHTVQLTVDGFDRMPGLHMTGIVRVDESAGFKFLCPAKTCERWNGPYGSAQSAIASWRAHIPAVPRMTGDPKPTEPPSRPNGERS